MTARLHVDEIDKQSASCLFVLATPSAGYETKTHTHTRL